MSLFRPRHRSPSGTTEPCLPTAAKSPPTGPNWVHEIKHDGFRVMARRDGYKVRLISRNGHDLTYRFPLAAALGQGEELRKRVRDDRLMYSAAHQCLRGSCQNGQDADPPSAGE